MTRQLIEITFGNAMNQANQLDACADDMTRLANSSIAGIKSDLSAAWQGDSANAYMAKMDTTAQNMLKTADKMRQIAETIRSVARIFRSSELRAIELAEQRSYQ